jgi:hypothetical protein
MEAVVVNSTTLKFLGNLYMKVKKPKIPTKVFEREKDALLWLGSYEQQQKFSTPKY